MSENCKHKWVLLSDDRHKENERFSTNYKRCLEFFCEKCLDTKKKFEREDSTIAIRSDWTYNMGRF